VPADLRGFHAPSGRALGGASKVRSAAMTEPAASTVTIVRDRWGIGHITADDALSAFWAQGWLAAADRIWQMEWDRRRALGRWAEVAGPGAVPEDRFFRRLDLASVSQADFGALDEQTRHMTGAYVAGINAWLAANRQRLPAEFLLHPAPPEPWEPWHCVAVYKVRHIFMGTLYRKLWRGAVVVAAGPDLARLMVGDPGSASAMVPPDGEGPPLDLLADSVVIMERAAADLAGLIDEDGGSNSWAVHGSRTASGKPLLAGDPHRGIEFPNVYQQCQIACPDFDVIGLAFPGVPGFPHFGHNQHVAWCITHGMADDTDVFVERNRVAVERTELVTVAGAEPVAVTCARTERGPVILGEIGSDQPVLSIMWTGIFAPDTTFECLWPMLAARSVDELELSVRQWALPVNNLLSADVAGDISFHLRGHVVERPTANRWTPVPGTPEHSWTGLAPVAFELLHAWRNPERGFLVTANNRTGDAGPYVSLDFAGPARHDRIVERLEPLQGATVADMTAIHGDVRSLRAPAFLDRFGLAQPLTEPGRKALALLDGWDHEITVESVPALIYGAARRLWADDVGRRLGVATAHLGGPGWPPALYASRMLFDGAGVLLRSGQTALIPGLGDDRALAAALGGVFDAVAAELASRFGPDPAGWTWGAAHTMVSPHPLATARPEAAHLHPAVDPCPGDGDTVRCGTVMPHTGDRAAASSVARYAFDLANWDASGWVVPHGVSGVRESGHDLDQRAAWLACELLPMAYSPAAVAEVAISTEAVTFEPSWATPV
jgi:penicillin G amidase